MRANWNAKLIERLHRATPAAYPIVEAVVVEEEDQKVIQDDWVASDSYTGYIALADGGAKLSGTEATMAEATAGTAEVITDLGDVEPFHVLQITWHQLRAEDYELQDLLLRLDPDPADTGKLVTHWRVQLYRVHKLLKVGTMELVPLGKPITVEQTGDSEQDVTFNFRSKNIGQGVKVGPPPIWGPEGGGYEPGDVATKPQTVIVLYALKGEGESAGNVAWIGDSGTNFKTTATYTVEHRRFGRYDTEATLQQGSRFMDLGLGTGLPRFRFRNLTYIEKTISFSGAGNRLDLGAVPTEEVECVAWGQTPADSAITYEIRVPAGTWYEYVDGDLIGVDNTADGGMDLSAIPTNQQTYDVRATLTPGGVGDVVSPIVRRVGVRERESTMLLGIARIRNLYWKVDPITLRSAVTRATVIIDRDGITDYRDYGTELFSEHDIGEMEFRVWIGAADLARRYWMLSDCLLVEDYQTKGAEIQVLCTSVLSDLKAIVPAWDSVAETRAPKEYANEPIDDAWTDLLTGEIVLAGRFVGQGPTNHTDLVTRVLKESVGKNELDAIAALDGGANITSQGQVKFVKMFLDDDDHPQSAPISTVIPMEETADMITAPGFRDRIMEFFVAYGWDENRGASGAYQGQVRAFHGDALTKLGRATLNPPLRLEDRVAKWIPGMTLATKHSKRVVTALGTGLCQLRFQSLLPHPYLEPGDPVVVHTDKFVGKAPNSGRVLRGVLSLLGVVAEVRDVMGTRLTVWIRSWDHILPSSLDISYEEYGQPEVLDVQLSYDDNGNVKLIIPTNRDGLSIRYDVDKTDLPTRGEVQGEDFHATDADHIYAEDDIITLADGETAYVKALAYEFANGSGSESVNPMTAKITRATGAVVRLELDVDLVTDPAKVSFAARSYAGDTLSGKIEFLDPERTFTNAGAITATDKTLVITAGDLTDEDVGKYVSVAGAGAGGILLESRIDTVTNTTTCELEDAAGTTVANATTIVGGGFYDDFDYSGSSGHTETNFRNRPAYGRDTSYITLRAVTGTQTSNPQTILLAPQVEAKILSFNLMVVDDFAPGSGDDQYTFSWVLSGGVTNTHSIYCEGGKEGDRETALVSGTEVAPVTNSSKLIEDFGAADGNPFPKHWGRILLKDPAGDPIGSYLEMFNVIPAV